MPHRHATVNDAVVTKGIRKIKILNAKTKWNPPSEWENQALKRLSGRPLGLIFGGIPGCLTLVCLGMSCLLLCYAHLSVCIATLHFEPTIPFLWPFWTGFNPITVDLLHHTYKHFGPYASQYQSLRKTSVIELSLNPTKKILTTACNRHANLNPWNAINVSISNWNGRVCVEQGSGLKNFCHKFNPSSDIY